MRDGPLKQKLIACYELWYSFSRNFTRWVVLRSSYRLRIMNAEQTLQYIQRNKCSIARYGDGELSFAMGTDHEIGFQESSKELSIRLAQVLQEKNPSLLLCMPYYLVSLRGCTPKCKQYWWDWGKINDQQKHIVKNLRQMSGSNYCFGDSLITRPYMDRQNIAYANKIFNLLKALWQDRDVLIVEGTQTRLGVGNDLFDGAKTVKRILAPAVNAFEAYDRIMACIQKHYCGQLIILALGPTATVMAADLAKEGHQALDLGHVDIEYEWFLARQTTKVVVQGKFTNELIDGRDAGTCLDEIYLSQILECI